MVRPLKELIAWINIQAESNHVHIIRHDSKVVYTIDHGIPCAGYFDDRFKILAVGTRTPDWPAVFVHEYVHMCQWSDGDKVWQDLEVNGKDIVEVTDNWVAGNIELDYVTLVDYYQKIVRLEAFAESTTVSLLSQYEHNINLIDFIREANSYILFYKFLPTCRSWWKLGSAPYDNRNIWIQFPDTFDIDYEAPLSKEYIKLYETLDYESYKVDR